VSQVPFIGPLASIPSRAYAECAFLRFPIKSIRQRTVKVAICIPTCQRPRSLARLLDSLDELSFSAGSPEVLVVVIDNDAQERAREVVEGRPGPCRWPSAYQVEPVRNIALARNRGIDAALSWGADLLAFIDDDEVASPCWLERLLRAGEDPGAAIVAGPVLHRYEPGVPEWVIRGRFFEIPRSPSGKRVTMAFTGNVLIRRDLLIEPGNRFDPAFGTSGGEDSHFFMRAVRAGLQIVWADDAEVVEMVPLSRARAAWILRRAYRVGNRTVFCERALIPRRKWVVQRVVKATGRIVEGLVLLIPATILGRAAAVRCMRHVAYGWGCITGLLGFTYTEYETIHGT
jgi:succinoglycan biosynthesis protein ExoM